MPEVKWIKLVTDMFDNRKIRQIETMPDADSILVIWLKLLCLAGKVNECGAIMFTPDIPYTDEMLSKEFDRPMNTVRLALTTFERFGMIELSDTVYHVSNWEKYQNIDGMEKIREQARIRNLAYRERRKLSGPAEDNRNVTSRVTSHDGTDIDIDKEEDIELPPLSPFDKGDEKEQPEAVINPPLSKPRSGKKTKTVPIDAETANQKTAEWTSSQNMHTAVMDFVAFRGETEYPMTAFALTKLFGALDRLGETDEEKIAIINQSIVAGYRGVFAVNSSNQQKQPTGKRATAGNIHYDGERKYTDEEMESWYTDLEDLTTKTDK